MTAFTEAWHQLAAQLGIGTDRAAELGHQLVERHTEPQRRYHTTVHIEAVIEHLYSLESATPTTLLAAFFHDVIYDPTRADNEERSAQLLESVIDHPIVPGVASIIRSTAGHQPTAAATSDMLAFLDADLSILGAAPQVYDAYADAIRFEYAHVPDEDYRTGRAAVLTGFAERDQLYFTDTARTRWDANARANLMREVSVLESQNWRRIPPK